MRLRYLFVLLALGACSSATSSDTPAGAAAATGDFVTWTQDGKEYRADNVSAYTYQGMQCASVNGGMVDEKSGMAERVLTLTLANADLKPGTYSLSQTKEAKAVTAGSLLLNEASGPHSFSTMAGPAATNGTITLTECDPQKQQLAGTFQFTAQALTQGETGTQHITAGAFRITRLQAAPEGM